MDRLKESIRSVGQGLAINGEGKDFNHDTWISLLGLLSPNEYFVPVDQTTLWRRHIAWAKPSGKEIRDYTTQRFATNMVLLSLLLGTEVSVWFNSAEICHIMRKALANEEYGSLTFWIGCVVVLSACVTILGLVTTFTAWGMISSISDTNSHCLLRSSMGQYACSLPARFVVAALYLFLLWVLLFVAEIMSGWTQFVLLSIVLFLFFQTIISLSAFGRLIIHTGAMGSRHVLDPELEEHLLPSGLHASLLIKATERCRRRTSVTSQYRKSSSKTSEGGRKNNYSSSSSLQQRGVGGTTVVEDPRLSSATTSGGGSGGVTSSVVHFSDDNDAPPPPELSTTNNNNGQHYSSNMEESSSSIDELFHDIKFPRPSVLNTRTGSRDLIDMVERTLLQSTEQPPSGQPVDDDSVRRQSISSILNPRPRPHLPVDASLGESLSSITEWVAQSDPIPPLQQHVTDGEEEESKNKGNNNNNNRMSRIARRTSSILYGTKKSKEKLIQEWKAEEDVRRIYDVAPPAVVFDEDYDDYDYDVDHANTVAVAPRSSRLWGRRSREDRTLYNDSSTAAAAAVAAADYGPMMDDEENNNNSGAAAAAIIQHHHHDARAGEQHPLLPGRT